VLDLADVPLFRGLDHTARARFSQVATLRSVRAGSLILRKGASGRELLVVASGGVTVRAIEGAPPALLGPGEVLGEMSLVTGQPISATVIAAQDTTLWVVTANDFHALVEECPPLAAALLNNLSRRLRGREAATAGVLAPQVVVLEETATPDTLASALGVAVSRYAPATEIQRATTPEAGQRLAQEWRQSATRDAVLLLAMPRHGIDAMERSLVAGDGVIRTADGSQRTASTHPLGIADRAWWTITPRAPSPDAAPWAFPVDSGETARVTNGAPFDPARMPALDRLVRWIARKQVGVAMGAGGARGFAHLGVLAELESLGLPIDCLTGTSMGGMAALLFGLAGNGIRGIELAGKALPGTNRRSWFPRSALFSDRELRRRTEAVVGRRTFAELSHPVAVVASDLVRGERVVLDRGSVALAYLATSALPGGLPPVADGDRVLVDGGVITRLPLDLLPRSRCAMRIAVNVTPSPHDTMDDAERARRLRQRFERTFGFRDVLAHSWRLLGWIHGTRDAAEADIVLEPRTREHSAFDFGASWRTLVDAGRASVREHASEIQAIAADIGVTAGSPH
jgi:NTE family protein